MLPVPRNWGSLDWALREKFSNRGLRFYGLVFAMQLRYFELVYGGQYV